MKDKMTNIPLHFFSNSIFYLNFIEKLFRENNSKTKPQEEFTVLSIFTGGTFYLNWTNFHEYLIRVQHLLKSGGTKDHFRWVKVPGTASY